MRPVVLAFAVTLASASAALAAPTCDNAAGDAVRCGTPGAMPVGWTPSAEVLAARQAAAPPGPTLTQMFGIADMVVAVIFLFVLLPDFEDGKGGGWEP